MKLVAIARAPADPDGAARTLADASGLALAEARMRLAREPPALLARLEPDRADALVASLRKAGLAALALADRAPSDRDRTVAHGFALDPAGLLCAPRFGEPLRIPWGEVVAVLRGLRATRSETEKTVVSKRFSVGTAVATGGLALTRKESRTERSAAESTEQVILVYGRDGQVAALAERELDFSCLGPGMQPSSTANMVELARRLRQRAPAAFHDDRLLRLGRRPLPFVAGGESTSRTATTTATRADTSGALDLLAEAMRQALAAGLLP